MAKSSILEGKESKKNRLLDTAFKLFTEKGIKDTSIQEIADNADIGKGTFYLYFKDKYELRDVLIAKKSHKLFSDALKSLRENYIESFPDQVIYIINYVIDELSKNTILLKFIYKNLSWGIYNQAINQIYQENENEEDGIYSLFMKGVEESNLKLENPDVTLSLIIELTSSTCFNSILYKNPLPINEFKPYLYKSIRKLLE
jgi:AcrR family transcriptional regulator